jgi:hypothetical protein
MIHAHWLEILLLIAAVSGLGLTYASSKDADRDWVRAAKSSPAVQRAISRAILMSSRGMLFVHFLITVGSTLSVFFEPPPPNYTDIPQSLILIIVIISVSISLDVIAAYSRLVRSRLNTGYYNNPSDSRNRRKTDQ